MLDELFSLDETSDEPLPPVLEQRLDRMARESYFHWRYKVEDSMAGEGATARVAIAFDSETGRRVALKQFRTKTSSTRALRRFLREAQVASSVQHPHVPPVLDFSVDSDRNPYFTLPVLQGGTLRERRGFGSSGNLGKPLDNTRSAASWVKYLVEVAGAAQSAHVAGIIHRDIKPANIVLDERERAFLIDWGAARWIDKDEDVTTRSVGLELDGHSLTLVGATVGTLGYLAPEIADGHPATIASDVYSLGATLYTMLAGRVPHVHEHASLSPFELMQLIASQDPAPLRLHCPDLPGDLIAIVDKAMARAPGERYLSADAFAKDLNLYLLGHPTIARRPTVFRRVHMAIRRRPRWAAVLAGLGIAIVAGAALGGAAIVTAMDRTASIEQRSIRTDIMRLGTVVHRPYSVEEKAIEQLREALETAEELATSVAFLKERRKTLASKGTWPRVQQEDRTKEHQLLKNQVEMERGFLARAELAEDPDAYLEGRAGRLETFTAALESFEEEEFLPERMNFPDAADSWEYTQLSKDIALAEDLLDPAEGALYARSMNHGIGLQTRIELATERRSSLHGGAKWKESWKAFDAWLGTQGPVWNETRAHIRWQGDLVFLGVDEQSGLPEFTHSLTGDLGMTLGEAPTETSAIVLVLLPGGTFTAGLQTSDPGQPNFVPSEFLEKTTRDTSHAVSIAPFFISKFEVSQGQWFALTGEKPSEYGPHDKFKYFKADGSPLNLRHPVESISQRESLGVLASVGLTLPTAYQWEYAARGGSTTAWPTGSDATSLEGYANVGDQYCLEHADIWALLPWNDGALVHNEVGSYKPNGFGLHDMIGNVAEWLIGPSPAYPSKLLQSDPFTGALPGEWQGSQTKSIGGTFSHGPMRLLPVSLNFNIDGETSEFFSGVRPCRNIRLQAEGAQR